MTDPTVVSDAEPEPAAEGAPPAPATVTITTPDGHEVVMTTAISGRDMMVLMELDSFDKSRPGTAVPLYPKLMAMIERHVVSHDYDDPDILSALEPIALIRDVMTPWQQKRAEQAVPKASGNRQQRRSSKRR